MTGLRPLAVAGALLFVAGAAVGWFRDIALDRAIPAHHLVSIGLAAWPLALPAVLASFVPFERRWLQWAWLGPAALVLLVAVAGTAVPGTEMPAPYDERANDRHVGLAMSLVGSLVAMLALLEAWSRARSGNRV